jgi:hypothetical protein
MAQMNLMKRRSKVKMVVSNDSEAPYNLLREYFLQPRKLLLCAERHWHIKQFGVHSAPHRQRRMWPNVFSRRLHFIPKPA